MSKSTFRAFIALVLVAVLTVGVCCMGYASRDNSGTWFGNFTDLNSWHWSEPIPEPPNGAEQPDDIPPITDDGSAELEKGEQNGVQLLSAKIPRVAYELNGISPQADTAFTLTATVGPDDAVNKVVDWSVAWENGESSWANGKEVTDYVTVAPTTDGAMTATATCTQAFGEKIIITAQVRDGSDDLKATCIANYVQRFLGANFKFTNHADDDAQFDYSWSFTPDNLNPEIDIIQYTSLWAWLYYCNAANFSYELQAKLSTVYTKTLSTGIHDVQISYTGEYLSAIRAYGKTPSVSAGVFVDMTNKEFTTGDLFFPTEPKRYMPQNASEWNSYRNSLKSNAGKVMFKIKCQSMFAAGDVRETVYEVKISSRSLDQLATNISLDKGEIDF